MKEPNNSKAPWSINRPNLFLLAVHVLVVVLSVSVHPVIENGADRALP